MSTPRADKVWCGQVERQIFAEKVARGGIGSADLLGHLPEVIIAARDPNPTLVAAAAAERACRLLQGGYVAPVFTREPALSYISNLAEPSGGNIRRGLDRVTREHAAHLVSGHIRTMQVDKVSTEARNFGRPYQPLW